MASSEQWPGKMATGDVNIQKLLQNDPNKRVRDYKPIERRKAPVIKTKQWREKEGLKTFIEESPGFRKRRLAEATLSSGIQDGPNTKNSALNSFSVSSQSKERLKSLESHLGGVLSNRSKMKQAGLDLAQI